MLLPVFSSPLREQVSRLILCLPLRGPTRSCLAQRPNTPPIIPSHSLLALPPLNIPLSDESRTVSSSIALVCIRSRAGDTSSSTPARLDPHAAGHFLLSSTHSETHGRCNAGAFSPVRVTPSRRCARLDTRQKTDFSTLQPPLEQSTFVSFLCVRVLA